MSERPRADAFPEGLDLPDRGCRLHPSCLSCPLPACVYDGPTTYQTWRRLDRASRINALVRQGLSVRAAAARVGCSLKTAYRALQPPPAP